MKVPVYIKVKEDYHKGEYKTGHYEGGHDGGYHGSDHGDDHYAADEPQKKTEDGKAKA